MTPTPHFEISLAWLHATGRRHYDAPLVCEVLSVRGAGHLTFIEVRVPWSHIPWTVWANERGRFV